MADYHPLIARAVAGLDRHRREPPRALRAGAHRVGRAVARRAAALDESEITRERLALEEAIRKVEAEAAQRAREARAPAAIAAAPAMRSAPAPGASAAGRSRAAARQSVRAPAPPSPRAQRRPPLGQEDRPAQPSRRSAAARGRTARSSRRSRCGPAAAADRERPARRAAARQAAPPAPGMRGFRDIAADADDLGRAAAQANRAARKTYANVPSPSPEFDRLEPSMENRGGDPDAPYSYDESVRGGRTLRAASCRRRARASRPRPRAEEARRGPRRCFRSRARSRSASC